MTFLFSFSFFFGRLVKREDFEGKDDVEGRGKMGTGVLMADRCLRWIKKKKKSSHRIASSPRPFHLSSATDISHIRCKKTPAQHYIQRPILPIRPVTPPAASQITNLPSTPLLVNLATSPPSVHS